MRNLLAAGSRDVFFDWPKRFQRILCPRQRIEDEASYAPLEDQIDRYEDAIVRKNVLWDIYGLRSEKIEMLDSMADLDHLVMRALEQSCSPYSGNHIRCGYYRWLAVLQYCRRHKQDFSVVMNTPHGDGRTILEALVGSEDHASLRLIHDLLPRGLQKGGIYLSHTLNRGPDQTVYQPPVFKYGGYAGHDASVTFYGQIDHGFPRGYGVLKWPGGHTYVGDWSGFGCFRKEGFRLTATFHDCKRGGLNFDYEPKMWTPLGAPMPVDLTVLPPICPGANVLA